MLKRLKQRLALDQRNIIRADVVHDGLSTVRVRTSRGELRDVIKPAGTSWQVGDQVQVATDGKQYTLQSAAPVAALDGEKIVTV